MNGPEAKLTALSVAGITSEAYNGSTDPEDAFDAVTELFREACERHPEIAPAELFAVISMQLAALVLLHVEPIHGDVESWLRRCQMAVMETEAEMGSDGL